MEGVVTLTSGPPVPVDGAVLEPDRAFAVLYRQELAVQVRRATLLVGNPETAHDLVQDAFVEVYRRWSVLREPGPYLGVAVLNRCRNHARRAATATRALPLLLQQTQPEDESLWDALRALPFNHRAAVVLRFYHQLPEQEIARLLGCRPGSVGPWIQRGLRRLRKDLS